MALFELKESKGIIGGLLSLIFTPFGLIASLILIAISLGITSVASLSSLFISPTLIIIIVMVVVIWILKKK